MIYKKLKNLRTAMFITQMELAKEIDIPQSCVSNWEKGLREPNLDGLKKLAEFFNVTTDYLLGLENTPPPQIIKPTTNIQSDEQQLIEAYRKLSAGQKKGLFQMLEIEQSENKANKKIN